jgi:hypothetical protein
MRNLPVVLKMQEGEGHVLPSVEKPPRCARRILTRDARKGDLCSPGDLRRRLLTSPATFDVEPPTLKEREARFSKYGRRRPVVVAESGGRVVGYASLSPFRDKPGHSGPRCGFTLK